MITLKIYLRLHKKEAESGMIWISFYVYREKINFSTSVSCNTRDWDEGRRCVKKSDENYEDKNLVISTIAARINNVFVKYRLRDKKLTRDSFWRTYNRPDDYPTFYDFIKANKKNINSGNEFNTQQNHEKVIRKLKLHAPNLHFDDITTEWLIEYFRYMRVSLKNNENTAYRNMAIIKKYVRAAWKMGYLDENPFDDFKIKRVPGGYTYLNESELQIFIDAYLDGKFDPVYHQVLEFFLFLCFSSVHIGDAKQLRLEQFTGDSFVYFRMKTKNSNNGPVTVPISQSLKMILNYIAGTRKRGLVFTKLPAEQTINSMLKDIAAELGVKKKLSTKSGRHTFATYFLAKTKDLTSLKEILGHSDIRETLVYAHVLDESKQEGILCFNKFAV